MKWSEQTGEVERGVDKDRIYFLIIVLRACSCLFEVRSRNYGGAIILHPLPPSNPLVRG